MLLFLPASSSDICRNSSLLELGYFCTPHGSSIKQISSHTELVVSDNSAAIACTLKDVGFLQILCFIFSLIF